MTTDSTSIRRGFIWGEGTSALARVLLLMAAVAIFPVAPASAQQDDPLRDRSPYVFVTLARDGAGVEGPLVALTETDVTVSVDGTPRTLPLSEVRRVERQGDATGDGAMRGALVLGLLCLVVCQQGTNGGGEFLGVLAVNTAFGAYLGRSADRNHEGRTTLYRQPATGWRNGRPRLALMFRRRF